LDYTVAEIAASALASFVLAEVLVLAAYRHGLALAQRSEMTVAA
jgi:hypothetical protein